jgi:hypothetical protein
VDVRASVPESVLSTAEKKTIAIMATDTTIGKHAQVAKEIYEALNQDAGMTSVDIAQVVTELQKLNKPTMKPMTNRFEMAVAAA